MKRILITILLVFFFGVNEAIASGLNIGVIKTVKGEASIVRDKTSIPAKTGDVLREKDEIVTGRDSSMGVIMKDDSVLSIGANTRLQFNDFAFDPAEKKLSLITRLQRGTLVYMSGMIAKLKPDAVRFETKTAVCGLRGTYFAMEEKDDSSEDFPEEQVAKLKPIIPRSETKKTDEKP